jgi:valyl-tRNA synthetase
MSIFDQNYDSRAAEAQLQGAWKVSKDYHWDENLSPELDYVIDTPPPTVSGTLHVGHIYSYTQADVIARYFRMSGRNVLYPIGWDDNGLPTERLVEKVKKVRGGEMSREQFVDLCRAVIPEYEDQFRALFSRLALSVDWSREYQTISDESRAISQLSFLDLYAKGKLERRLEPTLWDAADRTAIAQAEVDEMERTGLLNTLAFKLEGGAVVEVATTRPELLAGCGALMIHPDHPRAAELIGQTAISPLYKVLVPIIADEHVDPEKGTGVVMCCTFGDVTDIQWWRTHKLPLRLVIDQAGRMRDILGIGAADWPSTDPAAAAEVTAKLAGLKIAQARTVILELLSQSGDLRGQAETNQIIPIAERSRAPLEIVVTAQWFIATLAYKDQLIEKGREIDWRPEHMRQRYESWVNGLKWDWAISRQRHFGVPLPVWYSKRAGEEGKILLPTAAQLPVDPLKDLPIGYSADEVEPERDVLDTWATSSVSPQLVTRSIAPDNGYQPELHQRLFPMSIRPQAHEIIRTWAFYTIVKALHHQQDVPWKTICISGWCLASDGSKMSKSRGNVIDPIKLLDEYGTDVVRYWTSTSKLGNDTVLSPNTLKQGKRLVTKLWNAAKLASSAIGSNAAGANTPLADIESGVICHPLDKWILAELADTVRKATASFEEYEYAAAVRVIEEFFWSAYCDNYIEFVKFRTRQDSSAEEYLQISAKLTLFHCTRIIIRLFAPFLPYLTETLAPQFSLPGDRTKSVHARGSWPVLDDLPAPGVNADIGKAFLAAISAMRKTKASLDVSMRARVSKIYLRPATEATNPPDFKALLEALVKDLMEVSSAEQLEFGMGLQNLPRARDQNELVEVALQMAAD